MFLRFKENINSRVLIGVETAVRNSVENERLRQQITELRKSIDVWRKSSYGVTANPPLQVKISQLEYAGTTNEARLRNAIQNGSKNRPGFVLFLASNPWAQDLLLAGDDPTLPRPGEIVQMMFEGVRALETARQQGAKLLHGLESALLTELGVELRGQLAAIESELAGYFMFRDVLAEAGLASVEPFLGRVIEKAELSAEKHRVIREQAAVGRSRNITLGLKVGETVVGSVDVVNSGDPDDCD